jgi:hypothetical protein
MRKIISISAIAIVVLFIFCYIIFYLYYPKQPSKVYEPQLTYDSSKKELVERKKTLMLKEYDSVFSVIGRETTIIYYLRAWTITLLTLWLTTFLPLKEHNLKFLYYSGLFIIIGFYLFEVSERVIIIRVLEQHRNLESIFNISDTTEFNISVLNYEFRDIQDKHLSLLNNDVYKVLGDPKVFGWSFFLFALYYKVVAGYTKVRENIKKDGPKVYIKKKK